MLARARLRGSGQEQDACIVNVSSRGLAATADNPPRRGEIVEIKVGDNQLVGEVKWSDMRRFGVALRERISVISLISGDSDGVTLKHKEAVRKQKARASADRSNISRKIQFLVFMAAGAAATLVVADFVGDSMQSLGEAKAAMAGERVAQAPSR